MDRSLKVATPALAATVVVPLSAPGPGASVTVTLVVAAVRLLPASRIRTVTEGAMATVETALVGCTPNTTWVGVPMETAKRALVAGGREPAVGPSVEVSV